MSARYSASVSQTVAELGKIAATDAKFVDRLVNECQKLSHSDRIAVASLIGKRLASEEKVLASVIEKLRTVSSNLFGILRSALWAISGARRCDASIVHVLTNLVLHSTRHRLFPRSRAWKATISSRSCCPRRPRTM
jgi:hypothetical protein